MISVVYQEYGIPADAEIHSTDFLMGRGGRPLDGAYHRVARQRSAIFRETLDAIRSLPGIDFGTVYRSTESRGHDYTSATRDVYRELVTRLDARLELTDDLGLIMVDGNGTDPGYRPAHRDSTTRHGASSKTLASTPPQ